MPRESKNPLGIFDFITPQSGTQQLVKTLHKNEAAFFKIFHASSTMMLLTTAREGRIIDINRAFADLLGMEREEVIGLTTMEYEIWKDSEQRKPIIEKIKRDGKIQKLEVNLKTRDKGICKALFAIEAITLDGRQYLFSMAMDITERGMAEAALRESKDRLTRIINCIGDQLFVKDRQHRFILVNDSFCNAMKMQPAEFLGKTIYHFMTDETADCIWNIEEHVLSTGEESVLEEEFRDEKGNMHCLLTKRRSFVDNSGNANLITVIREITEYKRLQVQFLQAQKMEALGVLVGGIAHDFNNMLNVINGYSDLILEDLEPDSPILEDLMQIKNVGKQAASLTAQLLAFGRKQMMQPEIINLNEVMEDIRTMLLRLIGENIKLTIVARPNLWLINADPGQIHQIIMNLAVNARDAMPQGGQFTIETANVDIDQDYIGVQSVTMPGPYIMLAISDTGMGMDEATQERLFEPFFTTKEKGKGTGLGLSTVYGIVKQNKGYIGVYSEPGKGTTFKIYFPRIEGEPAKILPKSKSKHVKGGHETILVAEDESDLRMLAGRMLRDCGYTVIEAEDGQEALRLAKEYEGEIHLLFTDAVMPGMGSRELVDQVKSIRPGIKVLYTSGYTDSAIIQHGVLDKDMAFLQKPYVVTGLVQSIRKVLDSN